MKCPKCNNVLVATGCGHAISNDPMKYGLECINPQCPDFHKVGRITNGKFTLDEEEDDECLHEWSPLL